MKIVKEIQFENYQLQITFISLPGMKHVCRYIFLFFVNDFFVLTAGEDIG